METKRELQKSRWAGRWKGVVFSPRWFPIKSARGKGSLDFFQKRIWFLVFTWGWVGVRPKLIFLRFIFKCFFVPTRDWRMSSEICFSFLQLLSFYKAVIDILIPQQQTPQDLHNSDFHICVDLSFFFLPLTTLLRSVCPHLWFISWKILGIVASSLLTRFLKLKNLKTQTWI